ncbi:MAG: N-acetyltransferase, partial [Paramuribaculum sp.]|nr:N-acetyltransferase [Paramuribaculum sp.]
MNIEITTVPKTRRAVGEFVRFGIDIYNDNPCFVPPLIFDEIDNFMPDKNPAYEFCEAELFMARVDGKPVGKIAVIINHKVNERTGKKEARFSAIDFIDVPEVYDALMDAAEAWARSKGMTEMIGPMGFTDMDHEGMLIDGFDEMGTMATIYNHAYYPAHMERRGYAKDVDWVEYKMTVPDKVPDKYLRIAEIVRRKYNLRCLRYKSITRLKNQYGEALFHLINRAYDDLYGYSPLTDRQIKYYIGKYLAVLRTDCICVIVDKDDTLVGVGISLPSLSKALRACRGRLFPTGWFHILRALKAHNDVVDLMLVAISPEYQNKG